MLLLDLNGAQTVNRFTHGFMTEMLQLKMLNNQKSFLRDRIRKLKDSLETQKRHEIFMVRLGCCSVGR